MKIRILATVFASWSLISPASAGDWGCKLLLCFANPAGWQSVPDCHPPVDAYLACAHLLFGACAFPTCPEGGGGGLTFTPFEDCPAGFSPAAPAGNSGNALGGTSQQSICRSNTPAACGGGTRDPSCTFSEIPRPVRPKPYSIDIKDATSGQTKTYYFTLN